MAVTGTGGRNPEAVIQCNRIYILVDEVTLDVTSVAHLHQLYHLPESGCIVFVQAEVPNTFAGKADGLRMGQNADGKGTFVKFAIEVLPGGNRSIVTGI